MCHMKNSTQLKSIIGGKSCRMSFLGGLRSKWMKSGHGGQKSPKMSGRPLYTVPRVKPSSSSYLTPKWHEYWKDDRGRVIEEIHGFTVVTILAEIPILAEIITGWAHLNVCRVVAYLFAVIGNTISCFKIELYHIKIEFNSQDISYFIIKFESTLLVFARVLQPDGP